MSSSAETSLTNSSLVYLDNNATTPVLPRIALAVLDSMQKTFGNPSSSHITGLKAKHLMETTRQLGLEVLGSTTGQLMFTSGATEGIQTAVLSALVSYQSSSDKLTDPVLLYGATEHKAVPNTLSHWNEVLGIGAKVIAIPVDSNGLLEMNFIEAHRDQAIMVCTMAVNNETGVYQDLKALETAVRGGSRQPLWMVDSVQALGKRSLELDSITIDYAPFSGHKLYGPKGIGFLYVRQNSPITPFIAGGGQESGLRSGTENIHGISALKVIFESLLEKDNSLFNEEAILYQYRDKLAASLRRIFPEIIFNNNFDVSVPTTLNFSVKGFSSKEIMDLFDAANIRVSSGSACSSSVTRSFVLDAMGMPSWQSESAIRLSFGPALTEEELEIACNRIEELCKVLSQSCLLVADNTANAEYIQDGLIQFRHNGSISWVYIDKSSKKAIVIDPYAEHAERIETLVKCQNLEVIAVLDTHTHNDRASYREEIADLLMPAHEDCDQLGWPEASEVLHFGQHCLSRIATPGHSHDSKSYLLSTGERILCAFVGDLLMPGGLGRTDQHNSDIHEFVPSLQRLAAEIDGRTLICSAHDYANLVVTDFDAELANNSLLREILNCSISDKTFIQHKQAGDAELSNSGNYLCGQIASYSPDDVRFQRSAKQIKDMVNRGSQFKVLDVREPQEHKASDVSHILPVSSDDIISTPISRIGDWLLTDEADKSCNYLVLCRSGSRSLLVCKALDRMGFSQVFNIKGGVALLS